MEKILEDIYYDFNGLVKKIPVNGDKDLMRMVFMLKKEKNTLTINELINKYNKSRQNNYLREEEDIFYTEKDIIHLTYPFGETIERIKILVETIGEEKWNNIFGFSYFEMENFIFFLIFRYINYNNYFISNNYEKIIYEKNYPLSKNCYITEDELNFYFQDKEKIKKFLELVSIDITEQKELKDSSRILKIDEKYYFIFVWDFLYNLYDILESKIVLNYKKDKFYEKRGKAFEKNCFNRLVENFKNKNVYHNLRYNYKDGNHEVDLVLELNDIYVFFECKSGFYDIHKSDSDGKMYADFKRTFGDGYLTINELNNYIQQGKNEFYDKQKNKVILDIKNKKTVFINLSLYNIEYLQSSVQKIDQKYIKAVKIYPICWNYIDFLTLIQLSSVDEELFEKYLLERYDMLNEKKSMTFDIDEIDIFGFITDERYEDTLKGLYEIANNKIDSVFWITNGAYRKDFNKMFNQKFINDYIDKISRE